MTVTVPFLFTLCNDCRSPQDGNKGLSLFSICQDKVKEHLCTLVEIPINRGERGVPHSLDFG